MGLRGRLTMTSETVYFVTTTVVNFAKIFTEDAYCDILIRNIQHYQRIYGFQIYGYVIMPSHFHWIVEVDPTRGLISDIMRDVKKYSAWDLIEACRLAGRDELLEIFALQAASHKGQQRKVWMRRFDDEVIRNAGMLRTKLEYIHGNPVRAGFVSNPEDYRYSSARNYLLGDHSVIEVFTEWF